MEKFFETKERQFPNIASEVAQPEPHNGDEIIPKSRDDSPLGAQHILLMGDCLCGFLGFATALVIWGAYQAMVKESMDFSYTIQDHWILFLMMLISLPFCLDRTDAYRPHHAKSFAPVFIKVLKACVLWTGVTALLAFLLQSNPPVSRLLTVLTVISVCLYLLVFRKVFHRLSLAGKIDSMRRGVLYVGVSASVRDILKHEFETDPNFRRTHLGVLTVRSHDSNLCFGLPRLGSINDLENMLNERKDITTVIVSDQIDVVQQARVSYLCEREMVRMVVIPSGQGLGYASFSVRRIGPIYVLDTRALSLNRLTNSFVKRLVDLAIAIPMAIMTLPIIALFCIIVWKESPGHSVIYRQKRMGLRGKVFDLLKIRSMRPDAETNGVGWSVQGDSRKLKIGGFIRKWNIDELPQLWNVITGDLSIVGPRPERPEHIENFKHQVSNYNARHFVRPGITGLAQVRGWRGDTDLNKRIESDLEYMQNWSLIYDFWILLRTAGAFKNAY